MSMLLMINDTKNKLSYLASDGRITTQAYDKNGKVIEILGIQTDNSKKISICCGKYLIGFVGSHNEYEIYRQLVLETINENMTYEEVSEIINNICKERYEELINKHVIIILSGINEKNKPVYTGFFNNSKLQGVNMIDTDNNFGIIAAERDADKEDRIMEAFSKSKKSCTKDKIIDAFIQANKEYETIGGNIQIYCANKKEALLLDDTVSISSTAVAVFRDATITGGAVKLGNTTITEEMLKAKGAYLDETSVYDGIIKGSQISNEYKIKANNKMGVN